MSSQGSIGNDRKCLLPNSSYDGGIGYINPVASQSAENYHGDDKRLAKLEFGSRLTISTTDGVLSSEICEDNSPQLSCSTPNISPNNMLEQQQQEQQQQNQQQPHQHQQSDQSIGISRTSVETLHKDLINDSTQYLIPTMVKPSSQENLIDGDDCTGSCEPLFNTNREEDDDDERSCDLNEQCFSNMNDYDGENTYQDGNDNDENYADLYSQHTQQVISNKSSKKIYKAVAKQWGITCKMNDQCRCMECQSNYFDCEYDQNDHQKTDGGLGATTPMFISEVMHGSACCIL